MGASLVARIVGFSCRFAGLIVLLGLVMGGAAAYYVVGHFAMNANSEDMISPNTQWRKREAVFDKAFPQQNRLILVVIDGATPERAEEATQALYDALRAEKTMLPDVERPDDGTFFPHDGLLFLPTARVEQVTQQLIAAQPFLGALAADPSLRGIADELSTAVEGVQHGQTTLDSFGTSLHGLDATLGKVLAGQPAFLSWQSLVTGTTPSLRQTQRFIMIHANLDFTALMPGRKATALIRDTAARLGLTARNGATVRITGPVPMADDEFGSLTDRARLMATLMMVAVLAMLWFALRSARLIFSVLLCVLSGLAVTTAAGLLTVGAFNLISVAFISLFVGLGVDFGIQFCVRYRAERHEVKDLNLALIRTGSGVGGALLLAAAATAAGFYSFLPTSYRGVSELGLVAGTGMLITFVLSITFLPAMIKILAPRGEAEEVGIRALSPLDETVRTHKRMIVIVAAILGVAGAASLPFVNFDFNPLDLRNPHVESVATALDLMKNPDTSPNTLDVLTPSHAGARAMAARLSTLPDVLRAMTIDSFVPDDQTKKIAIISDADTLLDPTINPILTKPAPSDAETVASLKTASDALKSIAGNQTSKAARDARALAVDFARLAQANKAMREAAVTALVPGLNTMLDQVRASLQPYAVTLNTLPADLRRNWISANGLYRVEAVPRGDANDNAVLRKFTAAVRRVAPDATGEPIVIQESGRTIVRAFIQAGALSFVVITILLFWTLRSYALVALALAPLVLSGIVTLATCVVIGLSLNYANIIALPLLLGIGVAFDIYFVVAWRSGTRDLLGSSLTRAVILSAGTTASAFGTLWIAKHPGTASMGELLAISLGWILVTVLFLLPALMAWTVPKIGLETSSETSDAAR